MQQGVEHELRVDVDLGHGAVVLVGGGGGLAKHARLDLSAGGRIKLGFNKSSRLYREISCQCRKGSEDTSYLVPMSVRVRPPMSVRVRPSVFTKK